jgi:cysteine desulfurase
MIYLDANATEPLRPEAEAAMRTALGQVGNPSSVHGAGRAARRSLEDARESLAECYGALPAGVVFTSGGTEADALAVHGLGVNRTLIIGATEHDAVRAAAPDAVTLPVHPNGQADLAALAQLLAGHPHAFVCLMLANNETGVIQPVAAAADLCRRHGAWLHVDAVQAAGRMPVSLNALGATSMAISSHKLGGPAGAGALLLAPDATTLPPLIAGGGQERGRRGGTPAVPIIAGFAAAARVARSPSVLSELRDQAEAAAVAAGAVVCGAGAERLPNTTCLALPGIRADTQVMALDLAGIAVSAGAACSSGKIGSSHVLQAMGYRALAAQAIRVSLPWNVSKEDISAFANAYRDMVTRMEHRQAINPLFDPLTA